MAYRGPERCHICGDAAEAACPACGNGSCRAHTLAGRLEAAERATRRAVSAKAERIAKRLGGSTVCETCLEHEFESARGPAVTIHDAGDPIEAEMLVEVLCDAGFEARCLGTSNAALLGAGQHIFAQRIEVPQAQAEEAAELVAALLGEGERAPDAELDAGDEERAAPDDRPKLAPRRRGVAIGLGLIFPGGSHYYAQRPLTALCVTVAFFAGLFWALAIGAGPAAAGWALALVSFDLIGGQLAVGAHRRGLRVGAVGQLVQGLGLVASAAFVAAVIGR